MEQRVEIERKATLELMAEELEERVAPALIAGNHIHVNTHLNHSTLNVIGDISVGPVV